MFSLWEMNFPSLHPVILVPLGAHRLVEDLYAPDASFSIRNLRAERVIRLVAGNKVALANWGVEKESNEGIDKYMLFDGKDQVDISEQGVRYLGMKRKGKAEALYVLSFAVPVDEDLSVVAQWTYEYPIERHHSDRNAQIVALWRKITMRTKYGRQASASGRAPELAEQYARECSEALTELARIVPSVSGAKCEPPDFADLVAIREQLDVELPVQFEESLNHPAEYLNRTVRERLAVRYSMDHEESVSAELLVQTTEGPSQRPQRGFSFLKELLGAVPPAARQNTGGEKVWTPLDLERLPPDARFLTDFLPDIAHALASYARSFASVRDPLDQLFYEFVQTGWEEASVVPVE